MTQNEKVWIAVFALAVLLTLAAGHWAHFPTDVSVTRLVQWLTPESTGWAQWVSS